jgi:hypothetical protein
VVSVRIICFNIKRFCYLPVHVGLFVFSVWFPKQRWILHLNSIKRLVLVMKTHSVFSEIGTVNSSQSQSYFTSGGLPPISSSWGQAPWDSRAVIIFQLNTCSYRHYVTSSLTRGWVCRLQLLLVLASSIILRSESHRAHDHILLPQIRDFPHLEGQVTLFQIGTEVLNLTYIYIYIYVSQASSFKLLSNSSKQCQLYIPSALIYTRYSGKN